MAAFQNLYCELWRSFLFYSWVFMLTFVCWVLRSFSYILVYGESIQFTNLPKDQTVLELGKQVLLPCSVSGSPASKVINWLKDNKPVNFNINFLLSSGTLRIDKTTKRDSGDYQCVASNTNGGVMSEKRKVIVACKFLKINPSRHFLSQSQQWKHLDNVWNMFKVIKT